MDSLFEELVAVDSNRAFNFFLNSLNALVNVSKVKENEILYVASVLAHYSQTSRSDTSYMPCSATLSEVFDYFILQGLGMNDAEVLEIGGSQVLLLAGFFRDQMSHRHNVQWYDEIGQSFYDKASQYSRNPKKQKLFDGLAQSFPWWARNCRDLSRNLRENRFLLRLE